MQWLNILLNVHQCQAYEVVEMGPEMQLYQPQLGFLGEDHHLPRQRFRRRMARIPGE